MHLLEMGPPLHDYPIDHFMPWLQGTDIIMIV